MASIMLATDAQRVQADQAVAKFRELCKTTSLDYARLYKSYNKRTKQLRVKFYFVSRLSKLSATHRKQIDELGFKVLRESLVAYFGEV